MCLPAIGLNKSVYTPAGTGGPDMQPGDQTYINVSYNFMTPIDEDRTEGTMMVTFTVRFPCEPEALAVHDLVREAGDFSRIMIGEAVAG